jgi:hypothetical protein
LAVRRLRIGGGSVPQLIAGVRQRFAGEIVRRAELFEHRKERKLVCEEEEE